MSNIAKNLDTVKKRITDAAEKCGRDSSTIRLLAVSKTKPAEMIKEAFAAGQQAFGENYVQEFKQKAEELADLNIEWHFIGHLQRNKVKYIIPIVKCIHSVNSLRLAEEIDKRAESNINCLIEVNIAKEESKSGISSENVEELMNNLNSMEKINVIGLMTMPPFDPDPEKSRPYFSKLRQLMENINTHKMYRQKLTELSMGMTGDLEVAIEEGATMVRVGTAMFGERVRIKY